MKEIHSLFELPDKDRWFKHDIRTEPFIYVDMLLSGMNLKFLTTLTSFGTPIDVTAAELQIEHYYPADEDTRIFLEQKAM